MMLPLFRKRLQAFYCTLGVNTTHEEDERRTKQKLVLLNLHESEASPRYSELFKLLPFKLGGHLWKTLNVFETISYHVY